MTEISSNPYVGPRTFTREEADRYFGREKEARDLRSLVLSERLVLFYAQSGAGKSSLINTRLVPQLAEDEDFFVLPIGRVSGELPEGIEEVDNIFLFNLLAALDQSHQAPERFTNMTLTDFLSNLTTTDGAYYYYSEEEKESEPSTDFRQPPHILIIDQFEEILTTHLDRWQEREEFFHQLDRAMLDDPMLWVLLTMREDHVAALRPYVRIMRDKMRARFYMKRMEAAAALEAVERPAVLAGRPFDPEASKALVNNLRQIKVLGDTERIGQFIEPVQMQVVCLQLWENLVEAGRTKITQRDLEELGDVDTALSQFYEQALGNALAETDVSEIDLRTWFDRRLITEAETRGTVYRGAEETAGMSNEVVKILSDQFLLRAEIRAGGTWYELVHDRFVEPILKANQAWRLRQSPLVQAAEDWDRSGRPRSMLYEDELLKSTLAQVEREAQEPLVQEFLLASEEAQSQRDLAETKALAEEQRRRAEAEARIARLLRRLAIALVVVFVIAVVFAVIATIQRGIATASQAEAEDNANLAATRAVEALTNAKLAATNEAEAITNAELARQNESLAVTREVEANEKTVLAAKNETISFVQGSIFGGRIDEALSLATENINRYGLENLASETIVGEALLQSAQSNSFLKLPTEVDPASFVERSLQVMAAALALNPDLEAERQLELANFYNKMCQELSSDDRKVTTSLPACELAVDVVSDLEDPVLNFEVCQYGNIEDLSDLEAGINTICDRIDALTLPAEVGESYSGEIGVVSGNLWTFTGRDGQRISIEMAAAEGQVGQLDSFLVLYGPDGVELIRDNNSGSENDAFINGFPLPMTGDYTIIARAFEPDMFGTYAIELREGVELTGDIGLDEDTRSSLDRGENEFWQFEGSAGQTVSFHMMADESEVNSFLSVRAPDGRLLAQDDESGENHNALIREIRLPENGPYMVMAAASGNTSGAYRLEVIDETTSLQQGTIQVGVPMNSILEAGDSHLWTFDGAKSSVIDIALNADDSKFDGYLVLLGPMGSILAEDDDSGGDLNARIAAFELPETGNYTIVASSYDNSTSGAYSLELDEAFVETTVFKGVAEVGGAKEARIMPGETHIWVFEGRQGRDVTIGLETENQLFDVDLKLYGPDQELIGESARGATAGISVIEALDLPEPGTYSIFAEHADRFGFGGYTLTLDEEVIALPTVTVTEVVTVQLSFTYEISWEIVGGDPPEAMATVNIYPAGGEQPFQYFRDEQLVEGPTFQYLWRLCTANPGTLTVTSADGQSATQQYFASPPCPTPTPAP